MSIDSTCTIHFCIVQYIFVQYILHTTQFQFWVNTFKINNMYIYCLCLSLLFREISFFFFLIILFSQDSSIWTPLILTSLWKVIPMQHLGYFPFHGTSILTFFLYSSPKYMTGYSACMILSGHTIIFFVSYVFSEFQYFFELWSLIFLPPNLQHFEFYKQKCTSYDQLKYNW